ncbi:MAG: MgtC/SapB family protein [Devosia sp.]|uniref:MgtC/SapB family protein n=1 Tax=Devosia sp. TaxID=1871048 RepID=UPI0024CBCBFE|nr:MgtC/SapB family protein [Devosia sp.]UYO01068.1 MAG: MgtC/SapB family protein [Devosia sp.]
MDSGNSFGLVDTHLELHIIAIRLALAALFGAVIGFEREAHSNGAGLRTHMLIAVAASLFTILAFEIYHTIGTGGSSQADPIRAVEAVTAGIAFLGAGAIFRSGAGVHGLTTGAGMWLAGAVGVATALGFYVIAAGSALLAVIVMAALRAFAHRVVGRDDEKGEAPATGRGEKRIHGAEGPGA